LRQAGVRLVKASTRHHQNGDHSAPWSSCDAQSCWLDRGVIGAIDEALATPEPAPVADGTVPVECVCGADGYTRSCPVHPTPPTEAAK
jgi:hypothetical protein